MDYKINGPSHVVDEQHFIPVVTTINGLIDPSFGIITVLMTASSDPNDIRVFRMHDDTANGLGLSQAHMLP